VSSNAQIDIVNGQLTQKIQIVDFESNVHTEHEFCSICSQQYHYRTTCQQLPELTQRWFLWCDTGNKLMFCFEKVKVLLLFFSS